MTTDTKNFEGHTAAPWRLEKGYNCESDIWGPEFDIHVATIRLVGKPDSKLLAAAPALLAERDELVKVLKRFTDLAMRYFDEDEAVLYSEIQGAFEECNKALSRCGKPL